MFKEAFLGEPVHEIHSGGMVTIPAETKHGDGAKRWFQHLTIMQNAHSDMAEVCKQQ